MERIRQSAHVVGIKQSKKALEAGKAELVFIADDADGYVVSPLEEMCGERGVEVIHVNSMKELAKACHVDVPTAVATILVKDV